MQKFKSATAGAWALAGVCCLYSSAVLADEEEGEHRIQREVHVRTATSEEKYWLGVGLGEVSEALQAHLDLDGGVLVQHVVPDSPAAKAGVKTHDILLKFGKQNLGKLHDLLKAVQQNEDQKNTLVVLRKGRKQTLKITPGERPDEKVTLALPHGRSLRVVIDKWLDNNEDGGTRGPFRFGFVGPGIFTGEQQVELPGILGDLRISINKQGDSPSKIVVKHGDKEWGVTEDKLDELPEDIRAHVQRMMGRGGGGVPLRLKAFRGGNTNIDIDSDTVRKWVGRVQERALFPEQLQNTLKELRREIESLRREVEKLRESPNDKLNDA